jgi:hypothetical protein
MYNLLVNLTPHTVHLFTALSGDVPTAIPSDGVARVTEISVPAMDSPIRWDQFGDSGMHQDVPLVTKGYGAVTGLPEPRPYTLFIVSTIVQSACPSRQDLVAPHDIVRDSAGAILGCRGFSRAATHG